jgi:P27 family predicted phage terminase small subunit
MLHDAGILTPLDLIGLELLCRAWAMWREVADDLERTGHAYVANTKAGPLALAHPNVRIAREWHALVRDYMREFFLTPRSRAEAYEHDPLDGARPTSKGA